MIILNKCEQLWASRVLQALDVRLTNHVVALSVNPALELYTLAMLIAPCYHYFMFIMDYV